MHQEEMLTMDQLLQLYEGLHETIRKNDLALMAIGGGFVVLVLLCSMFSILVMWTPGTASGFSGTTLLHIPTLAFALMSLYIGLAKIKRIKAESNEARSTLKGVVVMVHEYRQTLSGLNPVFLKAVDLRLLRL